MSLRAFGLTCRICPLLAATGASLMSSSASDALAARRARVSRGPVVVRLPGSDKSWRFDGSALAKLSPSYPWTALDEAAADTDVLVSSKRVPRLDDAVALLDRLQEGETQTYSDVSTNFPTLTQLLRASAPKTLDVPDAYSSAKAELARRFRSGPHDPVPLENVPDVEEALALSRAHGVDEIEAGLFYAFVTTAHFEDDTHVVPPSATSTSDLSSPPPARPCLLAPPDLARAHTLQAKLLEFFSPTLFQAPPARHMACTDAIADTWLTLVIPCAMASSADGADGDEKTRLSRELDLGRPLESLRALEVLDWEARGVCKTCTEGRRAECREDREDIWQKMISWLA